MGRVVTPGNSFNYLNELLKIYLSEFSQSWIYQYYYKYYWINKSVEAVNWIVGFISQFSRRIIIGFIRKLFSWVYLWSER